VPTETGATLPAAIDGVRHAAQRKLLHELGIPASQTPVERFDFLTRIHYKAASDGKWGEHEIDYILLLRDADVTLRPSANEVRDTRWVTPGELRRMFEDEGNEFTPWFRLICERLLFEWWECIGDEERLRRHMNERHIRRML